MLKVLLNVMLMSVPALAFASGGEERILNWNELFWRVATFSIYAFILFKILKKPIMNGLAKRTDDIRAAIEAAEKAREDAQVEMANYDLKLKEMDKELALMKERAVQAAEAEKDAIRADAEANVAKMKKFAENLISSEVIRAKEDLRREAVKLAVEMVETRLGKELDEATQKELTQQYMKRIGAQN